MSPPVCRPVAERATANFQGLPEVLKRTAVDKDVHVKARQWSAAFLHRLAQRKNGGGWQIISDVGLELMQR